MASKEYKATKNYLFNTLGVTKEVVYAYLDEKLEKHIRQYIFETAYSKRLNELIIDRVKEVISKGIKAGFYGPRTFDDLVRSMIREEVSKRVSESVEVTLVVKNNGTSEKQSKKLVEKETKTVKKVDVQ